MRMLLYKITLAIQHPRNWLFRYVEPSSISVDISLILG